MSIVIVENKRRYTNQRKFLMYITVMAVLFGVMGFLFSKALERTIPQSSPQVSEEILRNAIVSAYEHPIEVEEDILFREISKERDLATNRDYLEYDYEYKAGGISHTGTLSVCYEYQNREWRLVSIGITNLNER